MSCYNKSKLNPDCGADGSEKIAFKSTKTVDLVLQEEPFSLFPILKPLYQTPNQNRIIIYFLDIFYSIKVK